MDDRKTFMLGRDVVTGHRYGRVAVTAYKNSEDMCYYPCDQIEIARDGKRLLVEYMKDVQLWIIWEEA